MNTPTRPTLHIGHFMTIRPILKNLSISLCLSCITTSLFASPAKLSSVKELMQMSQIDYLLKESINELTPTMINKQNRSLAILRASKL